MAGSLIKRCSDCSWCCCLNTSSMTSWTKPGPWDPGPSEFGHQHQQGPTSILQQQLDWPMNQPVEMIPSRARWMPPGQCLMIAGGATHSAVAGDMLHQGTSSSLAREGAPWVRAGDFPQMERDFFTCFLYDLTSVKNRTWEGNQGNYASSGIDNYLEGQLPSSSPSGEPSNYLEGHLYW